MTQGGSLARTHEEAGLPRGRASLPASTVAAAQRERLIAATVAVMAESGFAATTVADIVRAAKVSRAAFYAHFADKTASLRAAFNHGRALLVESMHAAGRALPADAAPEDQWRAGCRAFLRFLADEPAFARIFYIDMPAAAPESLPDMEASHRQFADINRAWHEHARRVRPDWPRVPEDVYFALGGAATQLVASRIRHGRTAELPELEDTLVALHLAVLAGQAWPG